MKRFTQFLFLFSLIISFAHSQDNNQESCRKIIFAGVEVACINKGIGPFSVEERAKAIEFRLKRLSEDTTFDTEEIKVYSHESTSEITAREVIIASISSSEVNPSLALNHEEMAKLISDKMKSAIKADRVLNTPTALIWGVAYTLIVTLGLIAILFLLSKLFQKTYQWIRSNEGRFFKSIGFKGYELLNSQRIVSFLLWLAQATRFVLTLVALYIYVPLVLSFFPFTANLSPKLYGYIVNPITVIFQVFIDYIPNFFPSLSSYLSLDIF